MSRNYKKDLNKFLEKVAQIILKNEKRIYFALFIFGIILLISYVFDFVNLKKLLAFTIFVVVGGSFKYFISRFRIFLEFTPVAFFAVLVAKYIGILWVLVYLIIADIVPSFLGHHGPDHDSFPHWTWVFIFSMIMLPFDLMNHVVQIIAPLVYFLGCLFIEKIILGGLNGLRWSSSLVNLLINFYFFVKLTEFFVAMVV